MVTMYRILVIIGMIGTLTAFNPDDDQETEAKYYLKRINEEYANKSHESAIAEWQYESNITAETLANKIAVATEIAKFYKKQWQQTIQYPWQTYKDPDVRRQFKEFSILGTAALPDDKYEKLENIVAQMQSIYSKGKICAYNDTSKCDLSLEPELTQILSKSRNEAELRHVWLEWRKQTGKAIRPLYKEYVTLTNEAAVLNNFSNTVDLWLNNYDTDNFRDQIEKIWQQLRPFYLQMHAYVRRKLREKYGEEIVSRRRPIPAHLLGNMWAQSWANLMDITMPHPNASVEDASLHLSQQGYTPIKMFKLAEEFFTSINLDAMPDSFWEKSILEKPSDRDLVCHASAWDFYDSKDFRIKQCTEVTLEDFKVAHHEMGHIQYYLQYKNQPFIYRSGANPGFHEAIGDVIALSVSTPKHLYRIGLLSTYNTNPEADLNYLFQTALDKITFLPFGYLLDLWRWNVFNGSIQEKDYNCEWWKLRTQYQGLEPPEERSEDDFDPAAKYHVVAGVPYIRYFVSFVIQFQFHQALCEKAGQFDPANPSSKPLHNCDIYQSGAAGGLLGSMLKLGSSKPWPDAMQVVTGQREMDAGALLQYFEPVYEWLKQENEKTGEFIGWEASEKHMCKQESTSKASVETAAKKTEPSESESESIIDSIVRKVRHLFNN